MRTDDLAFEDVEAWGRRLRVLEMTADEAASLADEVADEHARTGKHPRSLWTTLRTLSRTLRDRETGELAFPGADGVKALGQKPTRVIIRLVNVANRVCGLGDEEVKKAEGESSAVPSGASSTS